MTLSSWFYKNRPVIFWLGLVLAVAVLERLVLALAYSPVAYNDSSSYRSLANAILSGWRGYDGTRTPGYPLFLALMGPDRSVYLAQLALGTCVTLAFFILGWQGTGRPAVGGLMALAHTLNLGQLFFEANLLTETLATFWLMAGLLGAWAWLAFPARRGLWLAGEIGATTAMAILTRPLYIFMPVWLALFLVFATPGGWRKVGWKLLAGILVPAALIVGAWVNYINQTYHMFSLSTMTGFHLVQHTGYYFEYVPDQYAALRDTFIRYRDARIAERGTAGNTIFTAIPEMQRVSGLGFYDLSRTLTRISIDLILHHPTLYLKYAAEGWWYFWRAPVYWAPEQILDANDAHAPGMGCEARAPGPGVRQPGIPGDLNPGALLAQAAPLVEPDAFSVAGGCHALADVRRPDPARSWRQPALPGANAVAGGFLGGLDPVLQHPGFEPAQEGSR